MSPAWGTEDRCEARISPPQDLKCAANEVFQLQRLAQTDVMAYNNACLTITSVSTPDPFITGANGKFYLTYTAGDRVDIWSSNGDLLSFGDSCSKTTVWRPPPNTDYSDGIWAPELHALQGRWYIYFAAANVKEGNKSHRMFVLGGPPSSADPVTGGEWEFLGPIAGLPNTQWQIDGTILHLNNKTYFVYSGWPLQGPDATSDKVQELFIAQLSSPTTASSLAVRISHPRESWERSGDHGINEGPQYLASPDGSWVGLAYSCAGSWTKEYKMNTLRYNGGDPLNPSSWLKSRFPLIQNSRTGKGPFGLGHGSFINLGGETLSVYHATDRDNEGWENRKARVQRVVWGQCGPEMGGTGSGPGEVGVLVKDPQGFMHGGEESHMGTEKKYGVKSFLHDAKEVLRKF